MFSGSRDNFVRLWDVTRTTSISEKEVFRNPGGVLPYVTLTGMCGPMGYGFQGVLS